MEANEKIKCVLCCKNLNSIDTPPESFKISVKHLWNLWNASFTDSQKDLFEAGAFSQLKFCFDCRGMIDDAVSLHEKLKSLKGCIEEHAVKHVEDEVEWPYKQFRAELKVVVCIGNRGSNDLVEPERLNLIQPSPGVTGAGATEANEEEVTQAEAETHQPPLKKSKKKKPTYGACTCQASSMSSKKNYGYVRKPSTNHPCDLCIVVCPTSAIAELHRKEVHQGMSAGHLSYHCENCEKVLNAVDYCVDDATLGSVFRLVEGLSHQNFKKFYMLCMGHLKDCKKKIVFAQASGTSVVAASDAEFAPVITGLTSNHNSSVSSTTVDANQASLSPFVIDTEENDRQAQQTVTSNS